MPTNDAAKTTKWLWLVLFLIGWSVLVQTVSVVAAFVVHTAFGSEAVLAVIISAALVLLSWLIARFAFDHDAPNGSWIAIVLSTSPAALLVLGANLLSVVRGTGLVSDSPWTLLGHFMTFLGPALVFYLEGRRSQIASSAVHETFRAPIPPAA